MAATKKVSKKVAVLLNSLYTVFTSSGNTITMIGEDDKTKIKEADTVAIALAKIQKDFEPQSEKTIKLLKNLGLNAEIKMIVKLKPE